MSTSGVVLSVDVEKYGATLTAATLATDVVLQVDDIVDFADEDDFAAGPQWLTVGDSDPMQYVSVDDDNDTVTLAAAIGTAYEAGEPVRMWDAAADAEVIGHVAWVELDEADEDDQPIPAEVTHDRMIFFGLDNMAGLIGARVSLEEDEDDPEAWVVGQVLGRPPQIDSSAIATPYMRAALHSNLSISSGVVTVVDAWSVRSSYGFGPWSPNAAGEFRIDHDGIYQITATAAWAANSTGARYIIVQTVNWGLAVEDRRQVAQPSSLSITFSTQNVVTLSLLRGYWVRVAVMQTTGAALDLAGNAAGALTGIEIVKVADR